MSCSLQNMRVSCRREVTRAKETVVGQLAVIMHVFHVWTAIGAPGSFAAIYSLTRGSPSPRSGFRHTAREPRKRLSFRNLMVVAAVLLIQQLWVVAVAQGQILETAVGRVPDPENAASVLGNSGTATTQPGRADEKGNPALRGERRPFYRLHKSDVLDVDFIFSPEFNQTVSVQPDGYIGLKGVGMILAEGQTVVELEKTVGNAYTPTLHNPEITIALKEFEKPFFVATGELARPGKYELRGDTTVNEAVAIAGGFTKQAKHSQVLLFRRVTENVMEARVLNVKRMLETHDLDEDLHLQPGDLLYVPQSTVSKIRRYMPVPNLGMYLNSSQF